MGDAALSVGDLDEARKAKRWAAVHPKPSGLRGCSTRGATETSKMTRALLDSFNHPEARDRHDVLTLVEAVRARLPPDDQTKLTYTGADFSGLAIEVTDVDESPLTVYAAPQRAIKRATDGIQGADARPLTEQALAELAVAGKMAHDPIFQNASPAHPSPLVPLAAASRYRALGNALAPQGPRSSTNVRRPSHFTWRSRRCNLRTRSRLRRRTWSSSNSLPRGTA
ncbi:hypothetical protein PSP31121_04767 [Pandoraea sputorum]|uniref:Uncharacterized protein n=1 Tax=Pandoraea sputorum TaxID=93222 RepID=A0A5E5BGP9_9BURK|nr:hypothetical protein PSP31121_04767 [Pandoraea sputorum]